MMPMNDAEYERLPDISRHRAWSLGLLLIWLVVDLQWHGVWMLRPRSLLILPMICIWFADELADRNAQQPHAWKIDTDARLYRRVGWVVLVLGMACISYLGMRYAPKPPPAPVAEQPQ